MGLKKMNINIKKNLAIFISLCLLLSFAASVQSIALAQGSSYIDITPEEAYDIINNHSTDAFVLDVRNETEYKFAHLYNALQIPCYMLENLINFYLAQPNATIIDWRSVKLMEHIDDPVIVYCSKGSRSAIAANILSESGFYEVYNVVGGIEAWLQADLPIYNTAHSITVDDNEITIDPWTSFKCGCETQPNSNQENVIQNQTLEIVDHTENFTQGSFSFDFNNMTYDNTVSTTAIWNYSDYEHDSNVTATLEFQQSIGDINLQNYFLTYKVRNIDYNFSVTSLLQPLNAYTYNASATMVRFTPSEKPELLSIERANFTSPITLSNLFTSLNEVSKDLARTYRSDGESYNDNTLIALGDSYGQMADELKDLSKLIHAELRDYDLEINQSIVILTDDSPTCWLCTAICDILIGAIGCTPLDYLIVPVICASETVVLLIETYGLSAVVCSIIGYVLLYAICTVGVGAGCYVACSFVHFCGPTYADYCWANGIGSGWVANPDYIVGDEYTIGGSAWIWGLGQENGGTIVCHLSQLSSGEIRIRTCLNDESHIWVFISRDNDVWTCILESFNDPMWIWFDLWAYAGSADYNYVAISAFSWVHGEDVVFDYVSGNN